MSHSFFAMLGRMRYINRWGLMRSTHRESLSEHTLDVAYLTHALCAIGNSRFGKSLDCGHAVLAALYHDCSEILTGDMPTPVKYQTPSLRAAYKDVEQEATRRLLSRLPQDLQSAFQPWFEPSEKYQMLVKAADKLSALIKCLEEEKAGNSEFSQAKATTLKSLQTMDLPEVEVFLKEFLPAYSLTLDEL